MRLHRSVHLKEESLFTDFIAHIFLDCFAKYKQCLLIFFVYTAISCFIVGFFFFTHDRYLGGYSLIC